MKRKLTKRLTALLLSALTVVSALPFLGWGMRVRAAEGSTAATAAGEEFMRIFHLDCGRKYFSVDEIKGIIDQLSANHYTHLQLAFGNDGFRFLLDDMSVGSHSSDGVKTAIQSANTSYSNGKSTSSAILSQTDMDAITAYAKAKGIGIIPLLNTPGHMTALLDAMKSLDSSISSEMNINQGSGSYFDPQTCTAAADLTKELVSKYARYFADKGSKYFNLGADECGFDSMTKDNGKYVGFVNYINDLNAIVKSNGMTSLAFNDGFYRTDLSTSAKIDTDVLVCYWSASGSRASTEALSEAGYKIINTNDSWYYVLGDYLNEIWASPQWYYAGAKKALQTIPVTQVKDKSSVTPVGSMLCLWCDGPHKDYSASRDNVYDLIKTMADSNPAYFKAPELPEQTLTDAASGITVTLKPSGSANEYIYSIEIAVSVFFTSKRTVKVTVSVTITENGQPYTNGATLKIPYETWDSYLAESGFGIDEVIELAANVSGDSAEVTRDDKNRDLILTVPHFSDVEIDATIANDSEAALNKKDIILDINGTATEVVSGVNLAGNYEPNPTGIASVEVTGKNAVAGEMSIVGMSSNGTYTGVLSDGTNYMVIGSDGSISSTTNLAEATQFEVTKRSSSYYIKGNGYYLSVTSSGGWWPTYTLTTSTSRIRFQYSTNSGFYDDSYNRYIYYNNGWTTAPNSGNAYLFKATATTPASTNIVFKGIAAGTAKVTIGDTEYTVKVRKAPVTVTVRYVCDGEVLGTTTVEAKDDFNGGYYYSMTAPSVSGYKYKSGKLSGTVTGADTVTLTYEKIVLDLGDTITLPISIIDYRSDGLLFDYTYNGTSYGYSLVHSDTYPANGYDSTQPYYGFTLDGASYGLSVPGTMLEVRGRYSRDNGPWSNSYSSGWIRSGMVEEYLSAAGLPVYTDATVQQVAYLLENQLYYEKIINDTSSNYNKEIVNTFLVPNAPRSVADTSTTGFSSAFGNAHTYENISNAYDLAWYLLNNLFTADTNMVTDNGHTVPIYGMGTNVYNGIILKKSQDIGNGSAGYVYDSAYATTYDKVNGYIYNTDVAGSIITSIPDLSAENTFWPIAGEGYDALYGNTTSANRAGYTGNGNFALVGSAQFTYKENDYFYFSGDDDVYLFINGKLAMDLGGAHGVCYKEINLSDLDADTYGLVAGEVATFTFFYMERCSDNSNFSMRTNIDLVVSSIDVEKKAYTANNDTEVASGSAVSSSVELIYDLIVRNNGNTNMTNFVFADTDEFGNRIYFGGTQSNAYGTGRAILSDNGPFTVWIANSATGETVGERITKSTAAEVTAYLATLTLAPGHELHVKGLKGTFAPGINSVFTYENTLRVTAVAGEQTLSDTAQHQIYSYDIGDTTRAYVVDFGLPVMLGNLFENVAATDFVTGVKLGSNSLKYGTASLSGSGTDCTLTYTLTSAISGAEAIVLDVELNIHGTKLSSKKYITIVPATTVYYEDNFSDFVAFAGNGCEWTVDGTPESKQQHADRIGDVGNNVYGYDDAYAAMSKFSLGSAHKVTVSGSNYATAKFSFYGTGFDVISATTNTSGTIVVSVTGANGYSKNYLVDTYYGYKYVNGEWKVVADAAKALWQIPVMKVANLDYGKYDVTITVAYADFFSHGQNGGGSYDFWLDAVRIYDPAGAVAGAAGGSQENYENAYKTDGECWPTYMELRDMIIRDKSFTADSTANGMIFIDGQTGNVSMADYTSYGPNNELYLANGQAVAFVLKASGDVADIQIALKNIVEGKNASCKIFAVGSEPENGTVLATATDMYRSIKDLNGKTVVIMNVGDADSILSITNLKVTYSEKPGATDTLSLTMDEKSALAALSAVDEVLNPKTPFEPGKVDVRVEDKDITVITSPDVDGIEIDGEKVTDFTVDSETGNRIWKKPIDRILKDNPEISVVARDSNGNVSAPVTAPVVAGGSIGALIGGFIGRLIKNILSVLFG